MRAGIAAKRHSFGPVHIIGDWTKRHDAARYYVSDQIVNRLTWRHGRKRFWIEPSFRDYKGYGFDLEKSRIADFNTVHFLNQGKYQGVRVKVNSRQTRLK